MAEIDTKEYLHTQAPVQLIRLAGAVIERILSEKDEKIAELEQINREQLDRINQLEYSHAKDRLFLPCTCGGLTEDITCRRCGRSKNEPLIHPDLC